MAESVSYPPALVEGYLEYARIQTKYYETGTIDLGNIGWIYPSTLLPCVGLVANDPDAPFIPPSDPNVAGYIAAMITRGSDNTPLGSTYVPIVALPSDERDLSPVLQRLYRLNNDGREYGGECAFKYVVGEFVANIYEHSHFHHAYIMAQKYPGKGFVEFSFYDDGMTIPGSLSSAGMNFKNDVEAIAMAVNGLSSKKMEGRGYGLQHNVEISIKGLMAEISLVSRSGILHIDGNGPKGYMLREKYKLNGTGISVRSPYPAKEVNIYEHLQ
ncbi:MAG: hypothetical protein KBH31_03385 [Methanomassiliicoccales archaeon]|jgi:hypothetical protein|nr:hypothetical protein [Methanomassiliicoccales archaeon]HRU11298.1 hypothetical protein [Methanomassiliicoccales archaeon]